MSNGFKPIIDMFSSGVNYTFNFILVSIIIVVPLYIIFHLFKFYFIEDREIPNLKRNIGISILILAFAISFKGLYFSTLFGNDKGDKGIIEKVEEKSEKTDTKALFGSILNQNTNSKITKNKNEEKRKKAVENFNKNLAEKQEKLRLEALKEKLERSEEEKKAEEEKENDEKILPSNLKEVPEKLNIIHLGKKGLEHIFFPVRDILKN